MSESVKVSIMFATPQELKSDMSAIIRAYKKHDLEDLKKHPVILGNALTYLVHQQGYKLTNVYAGLYGGETSNDFTSSVCDAVQSNPSDLLSELCCIVTMPVNEAQGLAQKLLECKEYLCFSKETEMFLLNEWTGIGSSGIALEKPFIASPKLVSSVHIAGDTDCFVYDRERTKIVRIFAEHPLDQAYPNAKIGTLSYASVMNQGVAEKASDVLKAIERLANKQSSIVSPWTA